MHIQLGPIPILFEFPLLSVIICSQHKNYNESQINNQNRLNKSLMMNIEKFVASYFDKKRAESVKEKNTPLPKRCSEIQNHSFHPHVNELPKSMYKPSNKTECSREEIFERLCTDRRNLQNKRTTQKLNEQEVKYRQTCTFQPHINSASKKVLKTQCTEEDPFERLYLDGINKKKLSETQLYQDMDVKDNYSFQPQTNYKTILNSEKCNMKPIHERVQQIMKQKREKMKNLQKTVEETQTKQKPSINQISEKIVSNKEEFKKNILDRLSGYIEIKKKKVIAESQQHERYLLKQCTFKPQINSSIEVSTNFHQRQDDYLKKLDEKMTSRRVDLNFQPEINKISEILMRQVREGQTFEDKVNRLAYDHGKKGKIQQIERQLYQQCTFEPQINLISKCLVAEHVSHKCNHQPKEEQYQFKPKINKTSQALVKMRQQKGEDGKEFRKVEVLNNIKMQQQYKELKQCTFKPRINKRLSLENKKENKEGNIEVRGYQNFLKKIEKINQIKKEEKQLKQKLFNKEKNYKNRKSTTPVQFRLSQGYNTKQAVKQQMRDKFQKQCTFKPQIISLR